MSARRCCNGVKTEVDSVEETIQTILRFGMLLFRGYSSGHIGSDL